MHEVAVGANVYDLRVVSSANLVVQVVADDFDLCSSSRLVTRSDSDLDAEMNEHIA